MPSTVLCDKGLDVSLRGTMTFLTNKMLRHRIMIILTSKKKQKGALKVCEETLAFFYPHVLLNKVKQLIEHSFIKSSQQQKCSYLEINSFLVGRRYMVNM